MEHTEVANSITESAQADPQPKLDSKKLAVFTLTPGELILLVEHWTMRLIRDELFPITYFEFSYGGYGRLFRTDPITGVDLPAIVDKHNQYPTLPGNRIKNWDRINEIAQVLGDELTDKTIVETYQEESQEYPRNPWIIIRYGNSDEKFEYEKVRRACGDQFNLEPDGTSAIASKVVERIFREGTPVEQEALLKRELQRYATTVMSCVKGPIHFIELFDVKFPDTLKPLVLSIGVSDPNPGTNHHTFFSNPYKPSKDFKPLTIEQGKKILAVLQEKGEEALKALVAEDQPRREAEVRKAFGPEQKSHMDTFVELTIDGKKERIDVHEICAVVFEEGTGISLREWEEGVEDPGPEPIVAVVGRGEKMYDQLRPSESFDEVCKRVEAAEKAAGL